MDSDSANKSSKALQAKLVRVCKQITEDKQPFSLVVKKIALDLPDRAQVPVDDLILLYEDLRSAAELEVVLHGLMAEEDFIHSLDRWNLLRSRPINVLVNPPDFLKAADPHLLHELQERIIDLQKKTSQASSNGINALAREVDQETQVDFKSFDPYTLLGKYWQLYWCLVSELIVDTSVETSALYAIGKAQKLPRLLAAGLAQIFEDIDTVEDLMAVEKYLNALRFFNRGLVIMPQINDEGMPLCDLPPLPPGQTYPAVEPELDGDALESWHRVVINWLTMVSNNVEAEGRIKDLPSAALDCKKISADLEHLKKSIWPALKLPRWSSESIIEYLKSEAQMLVDMGAASEAGGVDWANMKSMEIITYLDEQRKKLGWDDESQTRVPGFFNAYHMILLEATASFRERALDRIDRQVINILRDQAKSAKRLHDELLMKPQTDETAMYVYQAITRTAFEIAQDSIQSGHRQDAAAVWKRIRDGARPWARVGRRYPGLSPAVNRLWSKLYRQAALNAIKVRFAGRRREVIIGASVLAAAILIGLGYIGLVVIQPGQPTASATFPPGTSTLNLPATMRYETAAARATGSMATSTAFAIAAQESRVARESTATAEVVEQIAATKSENLARVRTATAQEIAYETAIQQIILDQTATATAQIYIQRATYEAILCRNTPSFLSYELSSTPTLSPAPGTRYYVGTSPFTVTASWTITNTSECRWGYLGLEPLAGEYDVTYSVQRSDGEYFDLGPQNTVAVSETVQLSLIFDPRQAQNVLAEWVLVLNNQTILDHPHLKINIRNWIIPVYPPTRTPTPEEEDGL
jgi:hypothetical protein